MIKIKDLSKRFETKSGVIDAVDGVSLTIDEGQIYGIMGYSRAGKSTLVRCINFLEYPDSGSIEIDGFGKISCENGLLILEKGESRTRLTEKDLRALRRSIGMIFQHFNLFDRRTVFENIAYPLRYCKKTKEQISSRVDELLKLVALEDKRDAYPSQLSGGQKQRVAIARALANDPKILLSDEATSALDPEATDQILQLLRDLNRKLGITIVMITHEMAVIKAICTRVAVMEDGRVVEEGQVYDVFSDPRQKITRRFTEASSGLGKLGKLIDSGAVSLEDSGERKLIRFTYTRDTVGKPLISTVSRQFGVDVNLLLANVDVVADRALGGIAAEISGEKEAVAAALEYIKNCGVRVEVIENE